MTTLEAAWVSKVLISIRDKFSSKYSDRLLIEISSIVFTNTEYLQKYKIKIEEKKDEFCQI